MVNRSHTHVVTAQWRRDRSASRELGNMISEAFHKHKKTETNKRTAEAKRARKKSSTAAEASEWGLVTSVNGNDFFKTKK